MAKQLKLGIGFGYWQAQPPKGFVAAAQEAEALGAEPPELAAAAAQE